MNNLGYLRRDPYVVKDNLILSEYDVAYSEIITFKDSGGQSIIDVTPVGIGRDPNQLQQLMKETGVNILQVVIYITILIQLILKAIKKT